MIPSKLLQEILKDPYYRKCIRHKEKSCKGRITFEHAWTWGGKQIQEKWAIVPCCAYHHEVDQYQDGGGMIKELNQYHALMRATKEDLLKYPKTNWGQHRKYFKSKYGEIT